MDPRLQKFGNATSSDYKYLRKSAFAAAKYGSKIMERVLHSYCFIIISKYYIFLRCITIKVIVNTIKSNLSRFQTIRFDRRH